MPGEVERIETFHPIQNHSLLNSPQSSLISGIKINGKKKQNEINTKLYGLKHRVELLKMCGYHECSLNEIRCLF